MAFPCFKGLVFASLMLTGCSSLPNSYEVKLADHLENTGAKMYGAYWCPHCAIQKKYFRGAATRLPYVECDAEGLNAEVALCQAAGIDAYPTWVIDGEYYFGAQPLRKLATLSGFEDPGNTEDVRETITEDVIDY